MTNHLFDSVTEFGLFRQPLITIREDWVFLEVPFRVLAFFALLLEVFCPLALLSKRYSNPIMLGLCLMQIGIAVTMSIFFTRFILLFPLTFSLLDWIKQYYLSKSGTFMSHVSTGIFARSNAAGVKRLSNF